MKYIFTLLAFVAFCGVTWAYPNITLKNKNDNESIDTYTTSDIYEVQNVDLSNKATFTVPVGHTLIVHGNLTVQQAYLFVYGTLELRGDVNANITVQTSGNGGVIIDEDATVIFNGDNQTLDLAGGSNIDFSNVEINDPGLTINGSYTITGEVTLGPDVTDPSSININLPVTCFTVDTNKTISSGTTKLVSCVTVNSGLTLTIEGGSKLVVTESITNNGSIDGENGSLQFAGSVDQTISGTGSLVVGRLIMSNSVSSSIVNIQQAITIEESLKLTKGVFTPNGNVTLKSTSPTDYAIIEKVESGASLAAGTAGNVNYQKHIGSLAVTTNGWWLLGGTLSNLPLSQWSELAIGYSIFNYNEPTGKYVKSTNLANGVGQFIYLKASNFTSGSKLLEETGRPITGSQSFNLTSDGTYDGKLENYGWNLICNPYASAIEWNDALAWTKSNVDAAIYIYNAANGDYDEIVPGIGNTVIAPGQAFWVKVSVPGTSASLSITEDAKSLIRSSIFRSTSEESLLKVTMRDPSNNTDNMHIRLKDGATDEFDSEYDAYKMEGNYLSIVSLTPNNTELSINSLPIHFSQKSIKLKVTSKQKGTHYLNFAKTNLESKRIKLKDNYLNKTVDLDEVSSYEFNITNDAASTANRFELVFVQEVNLAIKSQPVYANEVAQVPVTVSNFKNILATQFGITWDESLMQFAGVSSFGLPSINDTHFNQPTSSSLAFAWDQYDMIPQSLADNDTLFVMQFNVTSSSTVETTLGFPGDNMDAEVIGEGLVTLSSVLHSGAININTTKTFAGIVADMNQKPIHAKIKIAETNNMVTTDATGKYNISVASGQQASLSVVNENENDKSGISTLDILMARRHLLAQEVISNPFILSAADVDGSGAVSVVDIAHLRQIILGHEENAISNKSWRYLSADTREENVKANDPEQQYDFVAVKIGDLNNSWNTNNARLMTADLLKINSVEASSGQRVEVPVSISQNKTITALQMTINYDADKLELKDVVSSDLQVNFRIQKSGQAIVLWDDQQATGLQYANEEVLFNLVFAVTGVSGESAAVTINSDLADAIVVDDQLNEYLIANSQAAIEISNTFGADVKFGNYPNPVVDKTNIVFNVSEAGSAQFMLFDTSGNQLEAFNENINAGLNSIEWTNKNYKSGIYILKMQKDDETYSTRMVIQ